MASTNRKNLIVHFPSAKMDFEWRHVTKMTPFLALKQENSSILTKNEDLHYFIFNKENISKSINYLKEVFDKRSRQNEEFWILDISSIEFLKLELNQVGFDFDDDILLFTNQENSTIYKIWEAYKLDPNKSVTILHLGYWSRNFGFNFDYQSDKWIRRGNLQVHNSKIHKKFVLFLKNL